MEKNTLNGFEVFSSFNRNVGKNSDDIDIDPSKIEESFEEMSDEELEQVKNIAKQKKTPKIEDDEEEEVIEDEEDTEEKEEPKKSKKASKQKEKEVEEEEEDEDEEDDSDDEEEGDDSDDEEEGDVQVTSFFKALAEKMNWEIDDEDEVPQTAEELIEYFQEVIEEASVPTYANEEVAKLDEFVRNGGDIRDYLSIDAPLDLDDIDIEDDEVNQKAVLKEFLKEKGFNSKQIEKKLTKYDEAGILSDEAEDALEALKGIREEKKQQLLEDQKKQAETARKNQQAFFDNVVKEIKGLDNIRGIAIPAKDKHVLLEYIFRPEADGKTRYQKDYAKSIKNLIESAYFTMKGDTLLDIAKKEGKKKDYRQFQELIEE
jgi:hypothetical protein